MQFCSLGNIEIQGSRANDINQSATLEATQTFSSFSFSSVAYHMLFILAMKIFSETVAYMCRSVLRLRDRSGNREVAREIEAEVGQRVASKKGSALNLRKLFFKKKKKKRK